MNYTPHHFSDFTMHLVIFVYNGTETISFLGPKVWDKIPSKIKWKEPTEAFNGAIKNENQKIIHVGCANVIYLKIDLSITSLQLPTIVVWWKHFFPCNILFSLLLFIITFYSFGCSWLGQPCLYAGIAIFNVIYLFTWNIKAATCHFLSQHEIYNNL